MDADATKSNGTPADVEMSSGDRERSLLILYGSVTGNAEDIAEELGRVGERLHFQTTVEEMNNVKLVSRICLKGLMIRKVPVCWPVPATAPSLLPD